MSVRHYNPPSDLVHMGLAVSGLHQVINSGGKVPSAFMYR